MASVRGILNIQSLNELMYDGRECTGIPISDYPKYPKTFLRYLDLPRPRTPAICIYQMAKWPLSG
jgi:hypothetical protein